MNFHPALHFLFDVSKRALTCTRVTFDKISVVFYSPKILSYKFVLLRLKLVSAEVTVKSKIIW